MSSVDNDKLSKDVHVFIKKEAFRNMITHVLKHGHEDLEEKKQVLGVCMGKLSSNGKTVELVNCLPILHGESVEEVFSEELKTFINKIDEKYQEENLNVYGYYHSHIGFGLFYSDTDIKNQQYFELKQSPFDFGIVFDPTEIGVDNKLGFEVFKLNEKATDFKKVNYKLEKPDSLSFFTWCKKLMEDYQKEDPVLIREILQEEESLPGELQEIPKPQETEVELKEESLMRESPILSGFREGTNQFNEIFMSSFTDQLNIWMEDISSEATKGIKLLQNITSQMQKNLNFGINKIKKGFERSQDEIVETHEEALSQKLENEIQIWKSFQGDLESFSKILIEKQKSQLNNSIMPLKESIKNISNLYEEKLSLSSKKINEITNEITNLTNESNTVSKHLDELEHTLKNEFNDKESHIKEQFQEKLSKLDKDFDNTIQIQIDLKDKIDSLEREIKKFKR